MIREHISKLNKEDLKQLCTKLGIFYKDGPSFPDFLATLEEAIEEYFQERQSLACELAKISPKRYCVSSQEQEFLDLLSTYKYNKTSQRTRLVSILRDPCWSYVYWDVSLEHLKALSYVPDKDMLGLRIIYDQGKFDETAEYYDIPLESCHGARYFSLPVCKATYWLELFLKKNNERIVALARSSELYIPQSQVCFESKAQSSPIWHVIRQALAQKETLNYKDNFTLAMIEKGSI